MELQSNLYIEFLETNIIQKPLRQHFQKQILVNFEMSCENSKLSDLLSKKIEWPKFESNKRVTGEIWSTDLVKKVGLIMIEQKSSFDSYNILIVVFKGFRGKGLGARITKSLFQKIAALPYLREIRIDIEQENEEGIKLLLNLGFMPVLKAPLTINRLKLYYNVVHTLKNGNQ